MTPKEAEKYISCTMEACSHCGLYSKCDHPIEKIDEAKKIAMELMRNYDPKAAEKYQKIEQIINDRYTKSVSESLDEIIKVIEDGNDD